jgi:hypothetical protein
MTPWPALLVVLLLLGSILEARAALFDPSYRAIFPADRAKLLLAPSCAPLPERMPGKVSGTWTPRREDVDQLERRLPAALKSAIANARWIGPDSAAVLKQWESIANHARQYAGLLLDGRKRILVIAAPIRHVDFDGPHIDFDVQNSSWRSTRPLGACDGGPNQFSTQYDPVTGNFEDFTFSGMLAGYHTP